MKEEHITLDVAFAMAQYVHASGDDLFFRQRAWPVIQGVAEWIASRVIETERGYEIRHITGIDEGRDNVDNDAETNGLASVVLREAVGFAQRLGVTPPAAWSDIAERLFIPIDADRRIVRKNDRYDLGLNQACPDTMMLTFPFAYPLADDVSEATVAYNLEHAHTYLGMPMNSANFAVWACRAGEREKAIEFIEAGMMSRVVQPYWQLIESTRQTFSVPQTVFVTACGAFMTALLQGLTGLHLDSGNPLGWARHPITLPKGWEAIEVERFWAHGEPVRLSARHGAPRAQLQKTG
jgi:trehalose/maltose hydrolase-like predicted phosphorylase